MIEVDNIPCIHCGENCPTEWEVDGKGNNYGMLSNKDFCLIGDCVIHNTCLDKMLEEFGNENTL